MERSYNPLKQHLIVQLIFQLILLQLFVTVYSSRAKIESVQVKPIFTSDIIRTSLPSSVGKVRKLFPIAKSKISRVRKIDILNDSINKIDDNDSTTTTFDNINNKNLPMFPEVADPQTFTGKLVKIHKPSEGRIYNKDNPILSSDTWGDLNTAFGDGEIKSFLKKLPINVLKNLTTMTRQNPEVGHKHLIRLMLDKSNEFQKAPTPTVTFDTHPSPPIVLETNHALSGEFKNDSENDAEEEFSLEYNPIATNAAVENAIYRVPEENLFTSSVANDTNDENNHLEVEVNTSYSYPSTTTFPLEVLESPMEQYSSTTTFEPELLSQPPLLDRKQRRYPFASLEKEELTHHEFNEYDNELSANTVANNEDKSPLTLKVVPINDINKDVLNDIPRQLNAGYFIPPLTTPIPPMSFGMTDHLSQSSDVLESAGNENKMYSWHFQPQDPENTFQPHIDKYMIPPSDLSEDAVDTPLSATPGPNPDIPKYSSNSNEASSSGVWVSPSESNEEDSTKIDHPFSGFHSSDIRFLPEASSDPIRNTKGSHEDGDGYNYYETKENQKPFEVTDTDHHTELTDDHSNQPYSQNDYKYSHSSVQHENPMKSQYTVSNPNGDHNSYGNYKPKANETPKHKNQKHSFRNYKKPNNNEISLHSSSDDTMPNYPYSNNDNNNNVEYGQPEQYPKGESWGWGSGGDNWGTDWWKKFKGYFKKGKKTTAEKVFEISIAALSFLAFGGYIIMLLYQVFAATTAFPLFPLFSTTVPRNPTIFGLLLGRSFNESPNESFSQINTFNETYIEELEGIVKRAMDRVKEILSSSSNDLKKGDLGN